jgi:hypothetical protein
MDLKTRQWAKQPDAPWSGRTEQATRPWSPRGPSTCSAAATMIQSPTMSGPWTLSEKEESQKEVHRREEMVSRILRAMMLFYPRATRQSGLMRFAAIMRLWIALPAFVRRQPPTRL